ncbi:MAG: hypothetical protein V3V14_08295 [Saprospiraceae bacterium]
MTIGDNELFECEITDDDDIPIPLTDTSIWFTIRKNYSDEDFIVQKKSTLAGGNDTEILVTDEAGGVCEIYLLADDTKQLFPIMYVYDVQIKNSTYGIKTVIKDGRIFLGPEVTKADGN